MDLAKWKDPWPLPNRIHSHKCVTTFTRYPARRLTARRLTDHLPARRLTDHQWKVTLAFNQTNIQSCFSFSA